MSSSPSLLRAQETDSLKQEAPLENPKAATPAKAAFSESDTQVLDSLISALNSTKAPARRLELLQAVGNELRQVDPDGVRYGRKAITLLAELQLDAQEAAAYFSMGNQALEENPAQAAQAFQQALQRYQKLGQTEGIVAAHSGMAQANRKQGNTEEALAQYNKAIAQARNAGLKGTLAQLLTRKGYMAHESGQRETSKGAMKEAIDLFIAQGASGEAAAQYQQLAEWAAEEGDSEAAIKHYKEAARLYSEAGNTLFAAHQLMALGQVYQQSGQAEEALQQYLLAQSAYGTTHLSAQNQALLGAVQAIRGSLSRDEDGFPLRPSPSMREVMRKNGFRTPADLYQKSATRFKEEKQYATFGMVLSLQGAEAYQNGAAPQALTFYRKAATAYGLARKPLEEATMLRFLGLLYELQQSKRNAIAALSKAESTFSQSGDPETTGTIQLRLGRLHNEMGANTDAISALQKAESNFVQADASEKLVRARLNLGRTYLEAGQARNAVTTLGNALSAEKAVQQTAEKGSLEAHLGLALYQTAQYREARLHLLSAVDHAGKSIERGIMARVYSRLGALYQQENAKEEALRYLRQCLGLYRELDQPRQVAQLLDEIAMLQADMGYWREALSGLKEAREINQKQKNRAGLGANELHASQLYLLRNELPQAEEALREARKIFDGIGDKASLAEAQRVSGELMLAQDKPRAALDYFEQALDYNQTQDNQEGTARLTFYTAQAYTALRQPGKALSIYEEALKQYQTLGLTGGIAQCYRFMGDAAMARNALVQAKSYFQEALKIGEREDKPEVLALNRLKIAEVYHRNGNENGYRMALKYIEEASSGLEDQQSAALKADIELALGKNYAALAMLPQALEHYKQALSLNRSLNRQQAMARCLYGIGAALRRQDQPAAALEYFRDVEQQYEQQENGLLPPDIYAAMANILEDQDNLDQAIAYHQKAAQRQEGQGNPNEQAGHLLSISRLHYKLKRWEPSRRAAGEALQLYRKNGRELDVSRSLIQLGEAQQKLQAYGPALEAYQEALEINQSLGLRGEVAANYRQMGQMAMAREDYASALTYLEKAESRYRELRDQRNLAYTLHYEGNAYQQKAGKAGGPALVKAIERQRDALGLARRLDDKFVMVDVFKSLQEAYQTKGPKDSTIKYLDLYASTKDSIIPIQKVESEKLRAQRDNLLKQKELELKEARIKQEQTRRNALASGLGLFIVLSGGIFYQFRRAQKARKRAEREHERSEELLLNILPAHTARELKDRGTTEARHYDEASILFADIKGFTMLSEKLPPGELVELLNTYFRAFDQIMVKYGLEKIKTIGDAYMAVGKLPEGNKATAIEVVQAALAMQRFAQKQIEAHIGNGAPSFAFRIGIHTGPVVAGVVGIKKFQYDIWGDTVNMAARMEQSGEPGRVNISEDTYALVKAQFACTHRGKIAAKNKGEVDMYYVDAPIKKRKPKTKKQKAVPNADQQ